MPMHELGPRRLMHTPAPTRCTSRALQDLPFGKKGKIAPANQEWRVILAFGKRKSRSRRSGVESDLGDGYMSTLHV